MTATSCNRTGDGIIALFGAPVACTSTSAKRAVHAAIAGARDLRRVARACGCRGRPRVEVPIGIKHRVVVMRSVQTLWPHRVLARSATDQRRVADTESGASERHRCQRARARLVEGYFELRDRREAGSSSWKPIKRTVLFKKRCRVIVFRSRSPFRLRTG